MSVFVTRFYILKKVQLQILLRKIMSSNLSFFLFRCDRGKAGLDQGIFNTVIHLHKVLIFGPGGSVKFILATSFADQSVGITLHE